MYSRGMAAQPWNQSSQNGFLGGTGFENKPSAIDRKKFVETRSLTFRKFGLPAQQIAECRLFVVI